MNKQEVLQKKLEFDKLYASGKYTQKEIATLIGISEVSASQWIKESPVGKYIKIRLNLSKELERLSANPEGNENLIFQYIKHLSILDSMIKNIVADIK